MPFIGAMCVSTCVYNYMYLLPCIGRAMHDNGKYNPGYINPDGMKCYYTYGNTVYISDTFDILVNVGEYVYDTGILL